MGCLKESFEQQELIVLYLMTRKGYDIFRHAACGDDVNGLGKGGEKFVEESVNHACCTVDDATLHALEGVSAHEVTGFLQGDGRQLRGALTEGIQRGLHPRDDQSAQKSGRFIDDSDGGSRAEVDDDGRCSVAGDSPESISQTILTQLRRRLDIDGDESLGIVDAEEMGHDARQIVDGLSHIVVDLRNNG